jgi:hypothetical protein
MFKKKKIKQDSNFNMMILQVIMISSNQSIKNLQQINYHKAKIIVVGLTRRNLVLLKTRKKILLLKHKYFHQIKTNKRNLY